MNVICLDLLPGIIEFIAINDLKCLRNVSPHIDRAMRSLKKCIFFGLNDVAYDFAVTGAIIIKLKSGRHIGLIRHNKYNGVYTNVEVYSSCYGTEITVDQHDDTSRYNRIDTDKGVKLYLFGGTFKFMQCSGTEDRRLMREVQIYDRLLFGRPDYIDMNTCYVVHSNCCDKYYYESFTVVYKDCRWQ